MNIIIITGASSGLGVEFALQLDNIFQKIDEIWLIARRKKEAAVFAAFVASVIFREKLLTVFIYPCVKVKISSYRALFTIIGRSKNLFTPSPCLISA